MNHGLPRISCVMLTKPGRPVFSPTAYELWVNQSYAVKELVIVTERDGPPSERRWEPDPRVNIVTVPPGVPTGAKRNIGCNLSEGPIIANWDDDDWYDPHRLIIQAAQLTSGRQVTGFNQFWTHDLMTGTAWRYTGFRYYMTGASLMFSRTYWELNRFDDQRTSGEYLDMMYNATRTNVANAVKGEHVMVARTHEQNTCPRVYRGSSEWSKHLVTQLPRLYQAKLAGQLKCTCDNDPLGWCAFHQRISTT